MISYHPFADFAARDYRADVDRWLQHEQLLSECRQRPASRVARLRDWLYAGARQMSTRTSREPRAAQ